MDSRTNERKESEIKGYILTLPETIILLQKFIISPDTKEIATHLIESLQKLNKPEVNDISLVEKCSKEIQKYLNSPSQTLSVDFKAALYQAALAIAFKWPINTIDTITQDNIEPENKIFTSDRFQFDINTLVDWINTKGKMINPMTNELFHSRDQEMIRHIAENKGLSIDAAHPYHIEEAPALLAGAIESLDNPRENFRLFSQPSQQSLEHYSSQGVVRRIFAILAGANILNGQNRNIILQIHNESYNSNGLYLQNPNNNVYDEYRYVQDLLEGLNIIKASAPQLLNQETFDELILFRLHGLYANSYAYALIDLFRNNQLTPENRSLLKLNPRYADKYAYALIELFRNNQLTPENRSFVKLNPKYAQAITAAIISLVKNRLWTSENQTIFRDALQLHPQGIKHILSAISELDGHVGSKSILTQENFNAIISTGEYSSDLAHAFTFMNKLKLFKAENLKFILQQRKSAIDIWNLLICFDDLNIASQRNFDTVVENFLHIREINHKLFDLRNSKENKLGNRLRFINQKEFKKIIQSIPSDPPVFKSVLTTSDVKQQIENPLNETKNRSNEDKIARPHLTLTNQLGFDKIYSQDMTQIDSDFFDSYESKEKAELRFKQGTELKEIYNAIKNALIQLEEIVYINKIDTKSVHNLIIKITRGIQLLDSDESDLYQPNNIISHWVDKLENFKLHINYSLSQTLKMQNVDDSPGEEPSSRIRNTTRC